MSQLRRTDVRRRLHLLRLQPESGFGGREGEMSRGKRNLLDIILIALGVLWCLICLACIIELGFWSPLELSAGLLLASPGIVCLLIGFRRKKEKADPKHEEN